MKLVSCGTTVPVFTGLCICIALEPIVKISWHINLIFSDLGGTPESVLSLDNVGEKKMVCSTQCIHFHGNGASALCSVEFDLLQNISFLPNCVYLLMN